MSEKYCKNRKNVNFWEMTKILSGLNPADYETVYQGKEVKFIVLKNNNGCEASISNFGANLISFVVPDKFGNHRDIVLGQPTIKNMIEHSDRFLGATVGRYANRIAKGKFSIDGKKYNTPINNDINTCHTGPSGFFNNVWDIISQKENEIVLKYIEKDGDDGWPGNLETILTIKLTDDNEIRFEFDATTDKATPCAFTQHSFFNLTNPEEDVFDTDLQINADFFTPVDDHMIPTGEILKVKGTVFDFTEPMKIGKHILDNDDQLIKGTGYDHNFCLRKEYFGQEVVGARAVSHKSGIAIEMRTNAPGMQLYTGNWMDGFAGKYGTKCEPRHAFCLEGGMFANSPNTAHFPNSILRPGEKLHSTISFKASVVKN